MNIRKIINELSNFFFHLRQSGTTTTIKRLLDEKDIYVLVSNEKIKQSIYKEHKDNIFTLNSLNNIIGKEPKPILVDSDVFFTLLPLIEETLIKKDKEIDSLNKDIIDILNILVKHKHKINYEYAKKY
jgi:hypothetical protein